MKRFLIIIIVFLSCSCSGEKDGYVDVFYQFTESVMHADVNALRKVSTESTAAIAERVIGNDKLCQHSRILDMMRRCPYRKTGVQCNIEIIQDSISADGLMAWIRFKDCSSAEELITSMININGAWLVDLPILDIEIDQKEVICQRSSGISPDKWNTALLNSSLAK